MKKVFSILLLAAFLFNIAGYRVVFYIIQQNAENRVESQIDASAYSKKDLFIVKVPINLPYQTNWADFERIDGEATVDGVVYKYIKRKVYNDTLILICLNFKEKASIQKNSNDYFKRINDLTTDAGKKSTLKQLKIDDFYQPLIDSMKIVSVSYNDRQFVRSSAAGSTGFRQSVFIPPDKWC